MISIYLYILSQPRKEDIRTGDSIVLFQNFDFIKTKRKKTTKTIHPTSTGLCCEGQYTQYFFEFTRNNMYSRSGTTINGSVPTQTPINTVFKIPNFSGCSGS